MAFNNNGLVALGEKRLYPSEDLSTNAISLKFGEKYIVMIHLVESFCIIEVNHIHFFVVIQAAVNVLDVG